MTSNSEQMEAKRRLEEADRRWRNQVKGDPFKIPFRDIAESRAPNVQLVVDQHGSYTRSEGLTTSGNTPNAVTPSGHGYDSASALKASSTPTVSNILSTSSSLLPTTPEPLQRQPNAVEGEPTTLRIENHQHQSNTSEISHRSSVAGSKEHHRSPATTTEGISQHSMAGPVQANLLQTGTYHGLLLSEDPHRKRELLRANRNGSPKGGGGEGGRGPAVPGVLATPDEVQSLERELERVRLHLHISTKERNEKIDKRLKEVRLEYEGQLKESETKLTQAQDQWHEERSELSRTISQLRRDLVLSKQEGSSAENLRRELSSLQQSSEHLVRVHEEQTAQNDELHTRALREEYAKREGLAREIEELTSRNVELDAALKRLSAERGEEAAAIRKSELYQTKEQELQQWKEKYESLAREHQQVVGLNSALEKQVALGHRSIAEAERLAKKEITNATEVQKGKLKDGQKLIHTMQNQLSAAQSQLRSVLEENDQLSKLLQQTQDELREYQQQSQIHQRQQLSGGGDVGGSSRHTSRNGGPLRRASGGNSSAAGMPQQQRESPTTPMGGPLPRPALQQQTGAEKDPRYEWGPSPSQTPHASPIRQQGGRPPLLAMEQQQVQDAPPVKQDTTDDFAGLLPSGTQ